MTAIKVPLVVPTKDPTQPTAWNTAGRGKRNNRRPKPTKPDALMIKANGQRTYAEILQQMKSDPTMKEVGASFNKVRMTVSGELPLELNWSALQKTHKLEESVEGVLGETAEVRALAHEIQVEIKDLDELTTKEEVTEALAAKLDTPTLTAATVRSIRKAYGRTKTAVVSLPADLAKKAIAVGKVRIGWVVCRIRERTSVTRCFRCWDYSHLARNCKGTDRSNQCHRCSEGGHVAKDCSEDPCCVLCQGKGRSDHPSGRGSCPALQKALQAVSQ